MNLMPLLPTLIQKGQLKKSPNIGSFASKSNEEGHVGSIILNAFPIRVEIDSPIIPTNREYIRRYIFPDPDPFRQRIPRDLELVRTPHCFRDRSWRGCRRFRWGRWGPWIGWWLCGFSENLTHARATAKESGIFLIESHGNVVEWGVWENGRDWDRCGKLGTNWGIWFGEVRFWRGNLGFCEENLSDYGRWISRVSNESKGERKREGRMKEENSKMKWRIKAYNINIT